MRRVALVLLLVLLVVAGCGDGDDGSSTATTAEATTTTTRPRRATTTTTTAPPTTTCPDPAVTEPLIARVDLDDDGVDEVWRAVGRGASVDIVELRRVEDCAEVAVLLDGGPAQFAVGGTVTHLEGIRCDDGLIVDLTAISDDGETYATRDRSYALEGGQLVLVDERTGELSASDPNLRDYSTFACR